MKSFKQLKWDLGEAKKQDAVEAIDRSANVVVRPADLRHKTPGVTVMVRKHKKHKRGEEAYDWTLREPNSNRNYYGTLRKNKGKKSGGWIAMATDSKEKEKAVITDTHGDSMKAVKKAYKAIAKATGSTALGLPLIARGNAKYRPLT